MSYAVYTTKGFILGSAPNGEASKVYILYTEDFGLVRAKAQGARLLSSKLRYNLEDFSFATFSLVRGKEFWRITGSQAESLPAEGKLARARILSLVKRLVHGEERNDKLFSVLARLATEESDPAEIDILAGILDALGYLDAASLRGKSRSESIAAINKALKESQL